MRLTTEYSFGNYRVWNENRILFAIHSSTHSIKLFSVLTEIYIYFLLKSTTILFGSI